MASQHSAENLNAYCTRRTVQQDFLRRHYARRLKFVSLDELFGLRVVTIDVALVHPYQLAILPAGLSRFCAWSPGR